MRTRSEILWEPFEKQKEFLRCSAFEVLYAGSVGSGKTDAMLIAALDGVENEKYRALILRRKMVDLERSLILRSHELFKGRGRYDGQKKRWMFSNNSIIEFGHCQKEYDIFNYKSAEYSFIGFEQVEQFQEKMYLYFFSRLRTTNPEIKCRIRSNGNPGGIGLQWIKKRFWILERDPQRIYKVLETIRFPNGKKETFEYGRCFIPAYVYDNEYILKNDRQYLVRLMELPENQRKALFEARWDINEGQFFTEWNPQIHICKPFEIPKSFKRFIAFDWGYNAPSWIGWFAEDNQSGKIILYRELYVNKKLDIEVMKMILEYTGVEEIYCIYYPWDLDNKNPQTGVSMHERMDDVSGRKFYWKEANRDRKNGWIAVRNLLSLNRDGSPKFQIFDTCRNLIRTLPEQVFDGDNSEDLDTLGEDHPVDGLRYFASSYRKLPIEEIEKKIERYPIDIGGAFKISMNEYRFKKEEENIQFSWMNE